MPPTANTIPSPRRLVVAAAAAGALLIAGCGSDEPEQDAVPKTATPATLRVTETDFAIKPANARIEPGAVRIAVTNRGQATHGLAIDTPDGTVETDTLDAGASGDVEADLEAGTYTWYCPVGDHRSRGMEGKLTVGSGGDEESGGGSEPPKRDYGY